MKLDFEKLGEDYPELKVTFDAICSRWPSHGQKDRLLNPRDILRHDDKLDPYKLSDAISILVDTGCVKQVYVVLVPTTNQIARGEFSSPLSIPEKLRDAFDRPFSTEDADIIPVIKVEEACLR